MTSPRHGSGERAVETGVRPAGGGTVIRVAMTLLVLALLCGACGGTLAPSPTAGAPAGGTSTAGTTPSGARSTPPLIGQDAVALATGDLAVRLDLPAAQVQLISDITVEMPLQGLGCVQAPSKTVEAAAPAQVMGHEVTLSAGGQEYVYHVYLRQVVLCSGMGSAGGPSISRPGNSDQAIAAAITDLAGRLKASEQDVKVVSAEPRDWPDAGLGCPEPGKVYAQVVTRGFLIVLETAGSTYEYHSSLTDARLCQK
jgi:hypothetical protein